MDRIHHYFPGLTPLQVSQFEAMQVLYETWNAQINVISRKDIEGLYERHVLHSLGIAKIQLFLPDTQILDVGTGGGFPGIPLAILFPETSFYLIDVIAKKIKVVRAVSQSLGLKNIQAEQRRAGSFDRQFDFVVSRAVTKMTSFVPWVQGHISPKSRHNNANGILCLKGGELTEELAPFPQAHEYDLLEHFHEPFFETKKVVHLPIIP